MPSDPQGKSDGEAVPLSDWTATRDAGADGAPPPETAFTPGTVLAGRYRVVGLLGRGGMGEVYRADDLTLGQVVALKFMRGSLSPELRQRLYAEVRIGRQVSHPNVCRLYDVVDVEDHTFLAMEYVDGEDLASLLARIGRLPPDKALEIARDLCAGLAAVHEKGIIHRDLKPANVMIDGRGRGRITDFGLALVMESPSPETSAGTPSYMAPEQLSGDDVTLRSDLYAVGLILHEMVTGQRFFDARTLQELKEQHGAPKGPKVASFARLVDAAVEAVVVQCLEERPEHRPASARAILAALPNADDPLDAAVAAGETPSPEMVAAAGRVGDLSPAWAWSLLALFLGTMLLQVWLADQSTLLRRVTLPRSPELLVDRARGVLATVAHEPPRDAAWSFEWDYGYLKHVASTDPSPERWERLRDAQPGPVRFFYRESPRNLVPANRDAVVTPNDPAPTFSGMAEVVLDPRGRLVRLLVVPPQFEATPGPTVDVDWAPLFREAGLDVASFAAETPTWAAPVDSDRKAAWRGIYPGQGDVPIRIEAASFRGRPVWFEILPPWAHPTRMLEPGLPTRPDVPVGGVGLWLLALAMPIGGALLARRNLLLNRGDRRAAYRVAGYVFASFALARLLRANHAGAAGDELWTLIKVFAYPAFWALQVWIVYIALEPYVRRRWPRSLISWQRLIAGRFDDPLVGRDVLVGVAGGGLVTVLYRLTTLAPDWIGRPSVMPSTWVDGATLLGFRSVGYRLFVNQFSAVLYALAFLFLLVLLRLLLRNRYLAFAVWLAMIAAPVAIEDPVVGWMLGALRAIVLLVAVTRFGLLALAVGLFVGFSLIETPLSFDLTPWYSPLALPVLATVLGLGLYAFHTSLAGKPLFGRPLLED